MKNTPRAAQPYQCFMGRWQGACRTLSPLGKPLDTSAVEMDVYWVDEHTWRIDEHFENLYGVGEVRYRADVRVDGKHCFAQTPQLRLEGTGLTAVNYVFTIESAVSGTTVYNNHYFLDPDHRRIMTHKVRDGRTDVFQIQEFVRVAHL